MPPSLTFRILRFIFTNKTIEFVLTKVLVGSILIGWLSQTVAGAAIFIVTWGSEGRFWRRGLLVALLKSWWKTSKFSTIIVLAIAAPRLVQSVHVVRSHLIRIKRKAQRTLRVRQPQDISLRPCACSDQQSCERSFHYSPLDSSDLEIRLLRLLPGSDDEQVRLETFFTSLNERPRYIALSYVWGSKKSMRLISVNGLDFRVTQNLFYALEHLRNMQGQDTGTPFWIDAICINQSDDFEKNRQVRLMTNIYAQAYKVMIWLGPPTENTELALAKMRADEAKMYIAFHQSWNNGKYKPDNEDTQSKGVQASSDPALDYEELMEKSFGPWDACESIIDFLSNPWWNRAWIAQEIVRIMGE